MCRRYLGFVLLLWLPAALHAQRAALPCPAPVLHDGFFAPGNESFSHGARLTYTCHDGHKPAVRGWWATSTCQNGQWSPGPQCIDVTACLPPTIPNANYNQGQRGWYNSGVIIRIECDEGYESVNNDATASCLNGTWTSVPVCARSEHACGEPPQVPHAVIIDQVYKELFATDSEVQYQCEDGYALVGGANKNSIFCISGAWTEAQACQLGSSSSYESDQTDTKPKTTYVWNCGNPPRIPNGDFVETETMYLKFQCANYYERVGPETVRCYNNGRWSTLPSCRATFCHVNTLEYPQLVPVGSKYVKNGDSLVLKCVRLPHSWTENYAVGRCSDTEITFTGCCSSMTPTRTCSGHITRIQN